MLMLCKNKQSAFRQEDFSLFLKSYTRVPKHDIDHRTISYATCYSLTSLFFLRHSKQSSPGQFVDWHTDGQHGGGVRLRVATHNALRWVKGVVHLHAPPHQERQKMHGEDIRDRALFSWVLCWHQQHPDGARQHPRQTVHQRWCHHLRKRA